MRLSCNAVPPLLSSSGGTQPEEPTARKQPPLLPPKTHHCSPHTVRPKKPGVNGICPPLASAMNAICFPTFSLTTALRSPAADRNQVPHGLAETSTPKTRGHPLKYFTWTVVPVSLHKQLQESAHKENARYEPDTHYNEGKAASAASSPSALPRVDIAQHRRDVR
ncbi:hypothetical protein Anapl_01484 [Anas platyrhynchos]|uniref:Uncharacterized protein n=1 Tax=Anas platyrhynchos TaxID=8839 RepID=R0KD44_ANAPL|nr:hypothetical protein Anapl_01484 [Anas platyrhynchos]